MPAKRCPLPQNPPRFFIGNFAHPVEYLLEHALRKLTRLRVLVRRMIGRQKDAPIGHRVFRSMAEFVLALTGNHVLSHQVVEIGLESDSAESDDDA